MDKDREKRLRKICEAVNKGDFGGENNDALTYGAEDKVANVMRWSSGSPEIDRALGGGWPRGRVVEVYGPESGGKTTTCLHAIAEFQKAFPKEEAAFIDVEYSFEPDYAEALKVDVDSLLINQPDSGEQAMNVTRQLLQQGVGLIIVDSVAGLAPLNELEGDIGDAHVGLQARLMSQSMRILTKEVGRRNATIFFTNQVREKIGVMYGDKTTTPGGRALKFYAAVRVEVRRIGAGEKENEEEISAKHQAYIKKNKTAPPFKKAVFTITYGFGIDKVVGVFDAALKIKLIERSGAWYSAGEVRLGQGKANALNFLRENEDLFKQIEEAVRNPVEKKAKGKKAKSDDADESEDDVTRVPVEADSDDEGVSVEDA